MNNRLKNGTVLPYGLLSSNAGDLIKGFNNTYNNTALRVGMILNAYDVKDKRNINKLTVEYDVVVIQQDANRGIATITYKNCISSEGLGSIADYFEKTLRKRKGKTVKGEVVDFKGQNGAIVLLLCLDALSEKAIIVGSLTHPDRKTNLADEGPTLVGEYNGVNVRINKDGSCSLTFKGATDNYGKPTDSSQGNTEMRIETDGSYQVSHKNTTLRLDKNGTSSLNTTGDVNVTTSQGNVNVNVLKGDINVNAPQGNITVTVLKDAIVQCQGTATVEGKLVKLGKSAVEAVIKGNTFADIFDNHQHTGNLGIPTSPPLKSMRPSLSKKVVTE